MCGTTAGRIDPPCVVPIELIGMARLASVGGKAAHLAELARIEGVHVPAGFCVTTDAFWTMLAASPG